MQQQTDPAFLAIGTSVSAKYKGAFCEAKVKSVAKQVKCRVTFKQDLGSTTLSDEHVKSLDDSPLQAGATVLARHPDKQTFLEATLNKIQDQSQYTVVFDDGDITTLRRNALCMKSGKHYNASESLDNLPLTHPEHFSTPVGGKRRRGLAQNNESDMDYDSSSENEEATSSTPYTAQLGRVVCIENSDRRTSWFPALIVAPAAGTVKIDTKEDYLVRSFKDGRYYTVAKKDTTRFHRECIKKPENAHLRDAIEKAIQYIEKNELPPHWDKETLFKMSDESTTESSESESIDDDEDDESPEEKDYLVAALYKHMEEKGQPINRTPSINNKELDLHRLFRIVYKLGGHTRVTNNNLWRQVALKLGFDKIWCTNQVRVHYKRYLQSFEDLQRTLGCTMINHPRSRRQSGTGSTSGSTRSVIRGKHRSLPGKSGNTSADAESDKSSIGSSQDEGKIEAEKVNGKKSTTTALDQDSGDSEETKIPSKRGGRTKGHKSRAAAAEEAKMTTRPRRDSTSSLAAAMQNKERKDNIGEEAAGRRPVVRMDRDKEVENEAKKLQAAKKPVPEKKMELVKTAQQVATPDAPTSGSKGTKKKFGTDKKKRGDDEPPVVMKDADEKQHLPPHVDVYSGDKIKVFYKSNTIYEAKVLKVDHKANEKYPRYLVHYQGWNARYDEWIKRGRVAENLSWTKDREKQRDFEEPLESSIADELETTPRSVKKEDKKEALATGPKERSSSRSKGKSGPPGKAVEASKPSSDTPSSSRAGSRTGSPALKRQSSRSSIKKESESESEELDDLRKSARLSKPSPSSNTNTGPDPNPRGRSNRKRSELASTPTPSKEESDNEEVDIERDVDSKSESKVKRGRRQAATPVKEDSSSEDKSSDTQVSSRPKRGTPSRERTPAKGSKGSGRKGKGSKTDDDTEEDPYAFKEPEPFDGKGGSQQSPKKEESADQDAKKSSSSSEGRIKRESDSNDSSSDETGKRTRSRPRNKVGDDPEVKVESKAAEVKPEDKVKSILEQGVELETSSRDHDDPVEPKASDEEVKQETEAPSTSEEGTEGKSLLQMTKSQRELFPFLSAIRTTTVSDMTRFKDQKSANSASSVDSASSGTDTKQSEGSDSSSRKIKSRSQSPSTYSKQKSTRKRKTPRKPNSSEIVVSESESDANSDEDSGKAKISKGDTSDERPPNKRMKKDDQDDMDLACQETIPGSPVHSSNANEASGVNANGGKTGGKQLNSNRLEMPFASVPESIHGPTPKPAGSAPTNSNSTNSSSSNNSAHQKSSSVSSSSSMPATLPPRKNFAEEDDETIDSSSASQSPRLMGPKSPGAESSEVDMDSLSGRNNESEDSTRTNHHDSAADSGRKGLKRRMPGSPAAGGKRRRKPREASLRGGRGGRGRNVPGRYANVAKGIEEETDEGEDHRDPALASLESLDNEALMALTHRPPQSSKYNFFVELTSDMSPANRIKKIKENMEELRRTYLSVKSDLAVLDRRHKKLRKKERQKADKDSNGDNNSNAPSSSSNNAIEASA